MNSPDDGNDDFNDSFRFPPHNNPYNINSRIMLTAITSLSIVIVVVVALHIYARCVLRRQARRRRAAFHVFGLNTANQVHEPPKGLDPTVIAALPTFVVKQTDGQDHGTPIECAVCLSLLEEQETARLLPNCKHTFHAECIDVWLTSHSTCPICRTEAEPRQLQPEPREGPAGEAASAPPLDRALVFIEGSSESDGGAKLNGSSSRLHSFRRMLSRDRSFRRLQEDHSVDLERQ